MILIPIALIVLLGVLVFFVDWSPEIEESEDERICAHTGDW